MQLLNLFRNQSLKKWNQLFNGKIQVIQKSVNQHKHTTLKKLSQINKSKKKNSAK